MKTYGMKPYYDDYDETKDYVQILASAGNYAQSREFTQMGTLFRDFIGRLGSAIFTNGQILSGCDVVINDKIVTMSPGTIYLEGLVRNLRRDIQTEIRGVGEEVIGVKIEESVITAIDDVTLRNPAVGTEGYNQEGASRVKQVIVLTVNDPDAASIYKLQDGVLYTEVNNASGESTREVVTDIMAKRTYDTSGNFKVEGLQISNKQTSDGSSQIYIGAGSAYIHGYNVTLQNMISVPCEIPTMSRACNNEPKIFEDVTDKFYFNNNPVKSVVQLTSEVEITRSITRGSISGGRDELPDQPVKTIRTITAGDKTYVQGTDFQLTGNFVDWSLNGQEPASGTTYQIVYRYMRDNIQGEDYEILGTGEERYIQFLNTETLPVANTQILVDYEFYLSRVDTVCMNKYADVVIIKGMPDKAEYAEAPINGDKTMIVLGTVLNYANTTKKVIANQNTNRLTQADLFNLKKRIDDLEYNQAVNSLDSEAKEGEDATNLKGILTDGFLGFTKCDLTNEEFDCSIDVDKQEMTVPFVAEVLELSIDNNSADTNVAKVGRLVTAPYTSVVAKSQNKATSLHLVNPYGAYNKLALCSIYPAVDNWISEDLITINSDNAETSALRKWWYHRGESWAEEERQKWVNLTDKTGTSVSSSVTASVKNETVTYMRQRTIKVTGQNFEANEDGIKVLFNGEEVTLTKVSSGGKVANSVRANSQGRFTCEFLIPEKTPCGSVEVRLEGPVSVATAVYIAEGTKKTAANKILHEKVVTKTNEPLAETFQFDTDTMLTGIDLFFAAKDSKKACVVQVRSVENGFPGTRVYAEEIVTPESITVGVESPVATHVDFSQPVYCEQDIPYCFVITTESTMYQLWVAQMSETDVVTGSLITAQPFSEGTMCSSSNGLTWSSHPNMDMTFVLYKAEFTNKGTISFENISQLDFDRLLVAAEVEDRKNTGVEWWYKVNGSNNWRNIETYVDRDTEEAGRSIDLRATINNTKNIAPVVAGDCINLISFKNKNKAVYISRQVEMEENFNEIKVSVQFALPAGCSARVYYKISDEGDAWIQLTDPVVSQVDEEFDKYVYHKTDISGRKYRVKVEMETVNPVVRPRCRKLMNILKY